MWHLPACTDPLLMPRVLASAVLYTEQWCCSCCGIIRCGYSKIHTMVSIIYLYLPPTTHLDGAVVWVYHKTPRHPEAHVVSGALIIREPYLVLGHFRAPPFLLRRAQSGSLRAPSGPVDARPGEGTARPGIPGLLPETPGKTPGLAPGMDRRPNPE